MADLVKRLNYFNHQFLRAPDFGDEQDYHVKNQREHVRLQHSPGIAEGLDIPPLPEGGGAPGTLTSVTVNAGTAFDDQGRRIVLASDALVEMGGFADDQAVYITVAYGETQSDPTDETGITGNTRWTEAAQLETSTTAPTNPNQKLVVARVVRIGRDVASIDLGERRIAGVKGGVAVTAAQIDSEGGTNQIVAQINAGTGVITAARIDNGIARTSQLPEKRNGRYMSGNVNLPLAAPIVITSHDVRGKLVKVRGWMSSANNSTPLSLDTGTPVGVWSSANSSIQEAWAYCKPTATPAATTLFSITDPQTTKSVAVQLEFTASQLNLRLIPASSFTCGYVFEISWQE